MDAAMGVLVSVATPAAAILLVSISTTPMWWRWPPVPPKNPHSICPSAMSICVMQKVYVNHVSPLTRDNVMLLP